MRRLGWLIAGAGITAVGIPAPVAAQPQPRTSLGLLAMGVASDPGFAGVGANAGFRLTREFSLVIAGVTGWRGDNWAGRGELSLRLDLTRPQALTRWYAAGGMAAVTGSGGGEYLIGAAGVERGRRGRWWAEAGFGGGIRIAVGHRWIVSRRPRPR